MILEESEYLSTGTYYSGGSRDLVGSLTATAVSVGGPAVGRPFYQQALVVIELFCPSSLQVMRPLSVSPAVVNMHGFDPRMDLKIPNKYPGHFNSAKRHPRSVP
ncbi:hypothetical protein BDDG_12224 [Blastomyces dermatitidis ATCC 18188]|uniref:Uncharacterized protein n=1 Tax=Ajellomyces dermatitidis (strain ATCC 18188 / CBS 674.68) TaxID=653446 RepID=A0A0J9ENK8_AJEDA|nr:hypothetical protein BDDG_12224 [Blastomyces dermatitidis ATCC 18188]